jgi:hypothetical protein
MKYSVHQIEDLLTLDFRSGINNIAKTLIQGLFKIKLDKYGKILLVPTNKHEQLLDLKKDLYKNRLKLRILLLNQPSKEDSNPKTSNILIEKGNYWFPAYEQIVIMDEEIKNELQPLLKSMFSNTYFFGDIEFARKIFKNNSVTMMDLYVKNNDVWVKWGYIQEIFGCTEEYKEI